MYYSEELREYRKAGFISKETKNGKVSKEEVEKKFGKHFSKVPKKKKYEFINGVPHKFVDGKMIPLTPLNK